MSWRAVNDEAPYRKVSKQSEGLEGFLRGDTVKVEASQDPGAQSGAKKGGLRSDRTVSGVWGGTFKSAGKTLKKLAVDERN